MPAPHRLMSTAIAIGTRLSAFHTSLGRIQLGYLAEADLRARVAAAVLKRHTPHTIADPERLIARIRADRVQGYSIVDEELELGLRSIAMPIVTRAGTSVGAINLSAHAGRTTPADLRDRFLPRLAEVTTAISRALV